MKNFKTFINNKIFNLDKFILEYYQSLGLIKDQAFFILLLLNSNQHYSKINLNEFKLNNSSKYKEDEIDQIVSIIFELNLLELNLDEDKIYISLDKLINTIENFFFVPSIYDSMKKKINWIRFTFNIEKDINDETIIEFIKKDFNKIIYVATNSNKELYFNDLVFSMNESDLEQELIENQKINEDLESKIDHLDLIDDFDEDEFLIKEFKKDKQKVEKLVQKNWLEDI